MKPTITDQLTRTVETLREVTLPHLTDHASRRTTESVIAGLVLVAEAWPRILPFLAWDNAEMLRLLGDRDVATPDAEVDPLDVEANDRLNEELRRRLEALVAAEPGQPDPDVLQHLDARARRYPLRYVPTLNTGTDPEEQ
ncbi:hypothetical protein [Nocardioides jensenii]|uniref:hypothetical protein n=1 Tax=Nocardioides jensenii TaxID=1843 RepID=UPI00082AF679|nr:hypothetical protein [Nocardioides jensenii]